MQLNDVYIRQRFDRNFYRYLYKLDIGNVCIFFSFATPIGLRYYNKAEKGHAYTMETKVADDFWGKFTKFHLNKLEPDKDKRVPIEYLDFHIRKAVKEEIDKTTFPWDHYRGEEVEHPDIIRQRGIEWYG